MDNILIAGYVRVRKTEAWKNWLAFRSSVSAENLHFVFIVACQLANITVNLICFDL